MVDSADDSRMDEAGDELCRLLGDRTLELNHCPVLLFANKQDLPNALDARAVVARMNFQRVHQQFRHPWWVQPCVATTDDGVYDGLIWIQAMIAAADR